MFKPFVEFLEKHEVTGKEKICPRGPVRPQILISTVYLLLTRTNVKKLQLTEFTGN